MSQQMVRLMIMIVLVNSCYAADCEDPETAFWVPSCWMQNMSNKFLPPTAINCDHPETAPWELECQKELVPHERWIYGNHSNFVEVFNHTMHYIDIGGKDQELVFLFLHGDMTWGYVWRNVVKYIGGCKNGDYPAFENACGEEIQTLGRVVVPDHVGFGRSDKPVLEVKEDGSFEFDYFVTSHVKQLEGLIDKLGLGAENGGQKLVLVGNDWGGSISLIYFSRHPNNVAGFVCVECYLMNFPLQSYQSTYPLTIYTNERDIDYWGDVLLPNSLYSVLVKNELIEKWLKFNAPPQAFTQNEMKFYRYPFRHPRSRWGMLMFSAQIGVGDVYYANGSAIGFVDDITNEDLSEAILPRPAFYWKALQIGRINLVRTSVPRLLISPQGGFYHGPGGLWKPFEDFISASDVKNFTITYEGDGGHLPQEIYPDEIGQTIRAWTIENYK